MSLHSLDSHLHQYQPSAEQSGHLVEPSTEFLTFSKSVLIRKLNQMFLAINFLNTDHMSMEHTQGHHVY